MPLRVLGNRLCGARRMESPYPLKNTSPLSAPLIVQEPTPEPPFDITSGLALVRTPR